MKQQVGSKQEELKYEKAGTKKLEEILKIVDTIQIKVKKFNDRIKTSPVIYK